MIRNAARPGPTASDVGDRTYVASLAATLRVVTRILPFRGAVRVGLAVVVALVGALAVVVVGPRLLPDLNPFATETLDRSQPALLQSLQRIDEYRAARANLQQIVDVEKDAKLLPVLHQGRADRHGRRRRRRRDRRLPADRPEAVRISPDGSEVVITLPAAQLEPGAAGSRPHPRRRPRSRPARSRRRDGRRRRRERPAPAAGPGAAQARRGRPRRSRPAARGRAQHRADAPQARGGRWATSASPCASRRPRSSEAPSPSGRLPDRVSPCSEHEGSRGSSAVVPVVLSDLVPGPRAFERPLDGHRGPGPV